jgi:histidyl-tRNA synthetase
MITALRGMKDLHEDESRKFQYIVQTASEIAQKYGFSYIETPQLEETKLFKRSVGDSSDIVGKEMYRFEDKGGNDVCLRPEGTAGVVRSFIEKKCDKAGGKYRWFYQGTMFRYERPQKGRLRQFHQFGCESFGEASVYEDLNIILMMKDIFDTLGIKYKLIINSLGCSECMTPFKKRLVEDLKVIEGLCQDCLRRIETNPVRVFDCKNSECKTKLQSVKRLNEQLCGGCDEDFTKLQTLLESFSIAYEVDENLVRGLDYYNKTAFEFVSDEIGAQSSIAGGGRYDKLVEFLDGKSTPAVGFAIGIERIMDLVVLPQTPREGWYLGIMCEEAFETVLKIAHEKRKDEKVTLEYAQKSLKAHLKGADKAGAKYCAVIGENELSQNALWVKDLETKEERLLQIDE